MTTERLGEMAYKQLKVLRKDFDNLRKEFGGLPEEEERRLAFFERFLPLVENVWKNLGIDPYPVNIEPIMVAVRGEGQIKPIDEVESKGKVVRRGRKKKKKGGDGNDGS